MTCSRLFALSFLTLISGTALAGNLKVNLSPSGAVTAGAQWRVDGGTWRNSGTTVKNLSNAAHTVEYKAVAGWIAPASTSVTLTNNVTTTVTGTYVQPASVAVTLTPSTGQWRVDGGAWRPSGTTATGLTPGAHTISYNALSNYASPATETVTLVANQTTNLSRSYTAVAALTVILTPANASWQVDGGSWQSSGATVTGLTPGAHTIAFSSVTGMLPLAPESISLPAAQATSINRSYTAEAGLIVNLTPVTAQWRVDGGAWQGSGARVGQLSAGNHNVDYTAAPGYTAPASENLTLVAGQTTTVGRDYTAVSAVTVNLTPSSATWQIDGGAWQASGATVAGLTPGNHTIAYSTVTSMLPMPSETVNLPGTETTSLSRSYTAEAGLIVTLTPSTAQWRVDGGVWRNSGDRVGQLTTGNHAVDYKSAAGYVTPASETVALISGETIALTRTYTALARLTVNLSDPNGWWQVDSLAWRNSGYTVTNLAPGPHTISYLNTAAALAPASESLTLEAGDAVTLSREYTPAGQVRVTLTPSMAQWRVDGGEWRASGLYSGLLAAGTHTLEFSPVATKVTPPSETINIVAGQNLTVSKSYATESFLTITLTPADGQWRVDGGAWRNSGEIVGQLTGGSHTVDYTSVAGFVTPPTEAVSLATGQTTTLTRTYTIPLTVNLSDPNGRWQAGTLGWRASGQTINLAPGDHTISYSDTAAAIAPASETLTLQPGGAVTISRDYTPAGQVRVYLTPSTGQWRVDGGAWRATHTDSGLIAAGTHTIEYSPVADMVTPAPETVNVIVGQTISISRQYAAEASLTINLTPAEGQWRVPGGAWHNSGERVALAVGNHVVEYSAVARHTAPSTETVSLYTGEQKTLSRNYQIDALSLTVNLSPVGQWRVDGGAWQASGNVAFDLSLGAHLVEYAPVDGFLAPASETVWLRANQSANLTRAYRESSGAYLNVNVVPAYLAEIGVAKWRVDGGPWNTAGEPAQVSPGTHTLEFEPINGLDVPPPATVTASTGEVQTLEATYYMPHRLRFFLHPDLVNGLPIAELQTRLSQYATHLQTVFERESLRRLIFNPATDISIVTASPFSGWVTPPSPEYGFEVWAHADAAGGSIYGSHGGTAAIDTSGAGGADGMHWTQIYDPSTLAPGSMELYEYWKQMNALIHEFQHVFGAGLGEYYSARDFDDLTGVAPLYTVDLSDAADPFWSAHSDFWADPLLRTNWNNDRIGRPTALPALLDSVRFSAASRGVINGCYRNADDPFSTRTALPDLARVHVTVVDANTQQPISNATLRMWHRQSSTGLPGAEETVQALGTPGNFEFSWMGTSTDDPFSNNGKLLKAYAPGYQPKAQWEWIYDAQRVKTVDNLDVWDITVALDPAP